MDLRLLTAGLADGLSSTRGLTTAAVALVRQRFARPTLPRRSTPTGPLADGAARVTEVLRRPEVSALLERFDAQVDDRLARAPDPASDQQLPRGQVAVQRGGLDELVVRARRDDPPSSSTTMRSASTTVDSRWATTRTVVDGPMAATASASACSLRASRLAVGSSRSRTAGRASSARAMASRCRCPPDSRIPSSPTWASSPSRLRSTSSPRLTRSSTCSRSAWLAPGAPSSRLSRSDPASAGASCSTYAMRARSCSRSSSRTSAPPTHTLPPVTS
jgi:hypothetical protein